MKKLTRIFAFLAHSNLRVIKYPLIWLFNSIYEPNLNEARENNLKDYSSLNDFFIRKIKEESRTIDKDIYQIGSPVDGVISKFGPIKEGQLIQAKGINYFLEDLVSSDSEAKKFKNGYFIEPTIIEGLSVSCKTNQEEIFGPVVCLIPFKTEEEVNRFHNKINGYPPTP